MTKKDSQKENLEGHKDGVDSRRGGKTMGNLSKGGGKVCSPAKLRPE